MRTIPIFFVKIPFSKDLNQTILRHDNLKYICKIKTCEIELKHAYII